MGRAESFLRLRRQTGRWTGASPWVLGFERRVGSELSWQFGVWGWGGLFVCLSALALVGPIPTSGAHTFTRTHTCPMHMPHTCPSRAHLGPTRHLVPLCECNSSSLSSDTHGTHPSISQQSGARRGPLQAPHKPGTMCRSQPAALGGPVCWGVLPALVKGQGSLSSGHPWVQALRSEGAVQRV